MLTRNIAYYETRIVFGMASLLPLLLLPGYMFLGLLTWTSRQNVPELFEAVRAFEWMLALAGGLAASHLMTIEREEGFDEIRRTYPERSWRMPMIRAATAVAFIATSALVAAFFFYLAYGAYDFNQVVLPAFAPAVYMCSIALLLNNVSGSYWIAAGVVVGYWYAELQTLGYYTQSMFLFNHSTPLPNIDPSLNRGLLILGALIFFAINTAFSAWRRRGAVGR